VQYRDALQIQLPPVPVFGFRLAAPAFGGVRRRGGETEYWLELLVDSGCVPARKVANLLDETRQLIAIFTTIDKNAKGERYNFSL